MGFVGIFEYFWDQHRRSHLDGLVLLELEDFVGELVLDSELYGLEIDAIGFDYCLELFGI